MKKTNERIIKASDVNFEGNFLLDFSPEQPVQQRNTTVAAPRARIIENNPEYAVIGITCSCGSEISVRCDYSNEPVAAQI